MHYYAVVGSLIYLDIISQVSNEDRDKYMYNESAALLIQIQIIAADSEALAVKVFLSRTVFL